MCYNSLCQYVVLSGDILAHSSSNTFRTRKHKYQVTIKVRPNTLRVFSFRKKKRTPFLYYQKMIHHFESKEFWEILSFTTLTRKLELHLNQKSKYGNERYRQLYFDSSRHFYSLIPKSSRQIPVYLTISLYWWESLSPNKATLMCLRYMWYLVLFTTSRH